MRLMPIQHPSVLYVGVRLYTRIHADVSAVPPHGNAHLCLSYLCKYIPTCVHKLTCHEHGWARRCERPCIGVTGPRVPPVLVADPCGVAPELGASPPGPNRVQEGPGASRLCHCTPRADGQEGAAAERPQR